MITVRIATMMKRIHAMADAFPIFRYVNALWKIYSGYIRIEFSGPPAALPPFTPAFAVTIM